MAREVWFPTNYTYYTLCDTSGMLSCLFFLKVASFLFFVFIIIIGEDPKCADSINPIAYRPTDHLTYLGYLNMFYSLLLFLYLLITLIH